MGECGFSGGLDLLAVRISPVSDPLDCVFGSLLDLWDKWLEVVFGPLLDIASDLLSSVLEDVLNIVAEVFE